MCGETHVQVQTFEGEGGEADGKTQRSLDTLIMHHRNDARSYLQRMVQKQKTRGVCHLESEQREA